MFMVIDKGSSWAYVLCEHIIKRFCPPPTLPHSPVYTLCCPTQVFMFMVNDKGSSWAYASPSFGSSLRPEHLKHMRELADLPHTPKHVTEVSVCVFVRV